MDKKVLLSYVGNIQQVAYVRPVKYIEGRASNLAAYTVKNGPLNFNVMADKCLDIADFSFKGININFLSKPGLTGRNHYDTHGDEALRSIMGGLFFTSGLENICAPCSFDGKEYPMHGRIRSTPAEHVSANASWIDGEYCIQISGEMREAELFGENMVLRRTIKTKYGEKCIYIRDEIENESFREEPMMLLYHFNMGYPMLSEKSRVVLPTKKITPRDEISKPQVNNWDRMEPPKANEPEYVFIHELAADTSGNTFAAIINEDSNIGIKIEFNQKYLPYFMEWKSTAAGDYVIGLEPSNSSVYGKPYHIENKSQHKLEPFRREVIELKITLLDGEQDISNIVKEAQYLINK